MKAFAASLLTAGLVSAQSKDYTEGVGVNGAPGQFVRLSAPDKKTVFPETAVTGAPSFSLTSWGVYYEDTGQQKVRIMAELVADIFATDTVKFQINFRPKNMAAATDVASIGEDTVNCEMTRKTSDGAFWSANISDGWMKCKGTSVSDRCTPEVSEP